MPEAPVVAAEQLAPGNHPDGWEKRPVSDLRPCGHCDGVIFYGPGCKLTDDGRGGQVALTTASYEAQALRYLEPMPTEWHAKQMWLAQQAAAQFGPTSPVGIAIGICRPQVQRLITKDMQAAADALSRRLHR